MRIDCGRWIPVVLLASSAALASMLAIADTANLDTSNPARPDYIADYQRPTTTPAPRNNPVTPEKAALGQMLFFDPRLSGSGVISCATCHNPGLAWGDALPKGIGHMGTKLGRRTPTILNVAYGEPYFWDGRAATLEEQAKGPLASAAEMNMQTANALERIQSMPGYRLAFAQAYPGQAISLDTVAAAIATYERTVVSTEAPFDRWVKGDEQAISASAKRGFALFNGKANCAVCHAGWRMSDDGFHDIGVPDADRGRAAIAPGIVQLEHAFKTPTLRNINQRAPYMHDGSVPTLAAVIDHYDHGFVQRASLDPEMKPLGLTAAEKSNLLEFLDTLTSADPPAVMPNLPQ